MVDQALIMRAGQAGAVVVGTPGHVLTIQSDGHSVKPEAPSGGMPGALRASWAFRTNIIFSDNASTGDVQADGGSTFVDVAEGDTLFVPPRLALGPPFHSGPAAPQFGGLYRVVTKLDDENLNVTRDERLATMVQIGATAFVAADAGDAAGVYQIATPATAVIDVDPQVMPNVAIPPFATVDGNTYVLTSTGSEPLLQWQVGLINAP
jgi:hypothetical protein